MKTLIFVLALIGGIQCLEIDLITKTLNGLDFKSAIEVQSDRTKQIQMSKEIFLQGHYFQQINKYQDLCKVNISSMSMLVTDTSSKVLIVSKSEIITQMLSQMECDINQMVYLLNEQSLEVFETYVINNVRTSRRVGKVSQDSDFQWIENSSMMKRRSNFYGIHLKSLTSPSGDNVILDSKYSKEAPLFSSNDTFEITKHVSGIIIDIISIFQGELNFTTNYFMRKDRKFGTVIKYSNGTFGGIGIVSDLFQGKADIIAGTLAITSSRIPYVDYLPSMNFTIGNHFFISYFLKKFEIKITTQYFKAVSLLQNNKELKTLI